MSYEIFTRYRSSEYSATTSRTGLHQSFEPHGSLPLSDFAVSTVTFHEQMLGTHAYINRARSLDEVVKGYAMMMRLFGDFKVLPLVTFDWEQLSNLPNYKHKGFNWQRWMLELQQLPYLAD